MNFRKFPTAVIGAVVISIALWLGDFPKPQWDDLFYAGAGIHMAGGGDFSNPLLVRQGWPAHYFFVYPPLHSYALAGWLKLFGVSALSLTAFGMFLICATCIASIVLLHRHGSPPILQWLVITGALFGLLPSGLRPEPFSIALAMCGMTIADRRRGPGTPLFFGLLLIYLGASAAPRVTVFALALAASSAWASWNEVRPDRRKQLFLCATHAAAITVTVILFLWMIHFQLHEFLDMFRLHASRFHRSRLYQLWDFAFGTLRVLQWPMVLIPLFLLLPVLKRPGNDLSRPGIFIMAALPVLALMGGFGNGTLWWTILAMLLLTASVIPSLTSAKKNCLLCVVTISLLVADRKLFIQIGGLLTGKISSDPGELFQTAIAMKPTPEHPLLVDSATARYVFDYKLPEGCIDGTFSSPFPGGLPGALRSSELHVGDIFIAGAEVVGILQEQTYLQQDVPKWYALGLKKMPFAKYPHHVYIFPTTDCKGPQNPKS